LRRLLASGPEVGFDRLELRAPHDQISQRRNVLTGVVLLIALCYLVPVGLTVFDRLVWRSGPLPFTPFGSQIGHDHVEPDYRVPCQRCYWSLWAGRQVVGPLLGSVLIEAMGAHISLRGSMAFARGVLAA